MNRREFFGSLLVGTAGTWLLLRSPGCKRHGGGDPRVMELTELFEDTDSIERVGRKASAALGGPTPGQLVVSLFASTAWASVPQAQVRELFGRQVRADFEAGRTQSVHGWVLSISEARLYALAALGGAPAASPAEPSEAPPKEPDPLVGDPAAGEAIYASHCAACHAKDGHGTGGLVAADLSGDPTRLAKSDEEIRRFVAEGASGKQGAMPAFVDTLSDQQIADVVAYVRQAFGGK